MRALLPSRIAFEPIIRTFHSLEPCVALLPPTCLPPSLACPQYFEFLQHALPTAAYRGLLPSMEVRPPPPPPGTAAVLLFYCSRFSEAAAAHRSQRLSSSPPHTIPHRSYIRPYVQELALEYSIDPELIWGLYRPLIARIEPAPAAAPAADQQNDEEGEIEGAGPAAATAAGAGAAAGGAAGGGGATPMEEDAGLEAGEVEPSGAPAAGGPQTVVGVPGRSSEGWAELEVQVRAIQAGGGEHAAWRGLSTSLYTTFWALTLYDMEVPVARCGALAGGEAAAAAADCSAQSSALHQLKAASTPSPKLCLPCFVCHRLTHPPPLQV